MSSFRVKGLLDRPSPQSLGMLGIVVERDTGPSCLDGVVGMSGTPIDESEFLQLLESGDAQRAEGPSVDDDSRQYSALWVGNKFTDSAMRLNVALPPLPKSAQKIREEGMYWVGPTQHVWRVLDSWLLRAFRRSVRENDAELATLMTWVLPDRPETRAAVWHTIPGERKTNLDWWARLDRDHGDAKASSRHLKELYKSLVREVVSQRPQQVFGFCASAKGGDKEIARELSRRLDVPPLGFGQWLVKKAKKEGTEPTRRLLQEMGQQMIQTYGALEFCLEVLAELPNSVSIPNAKFVIEGIRHADVLRSLEFLIGEDHFTLVHIERPEGERRRLLIEDEKVPLGEVDAVMNDPTEQEIASVATHAAKRYSMELGVHGIATELAGIR